MVFHPEPAGDISHRINPQHVGLSYWAQANKLAAQTFIARNSHPQALPATETEIQLMPAEHRDAARAAQFRIHSVELAALGPIGRNGVRWSDTREDRETATQNRPAPCERDVCMVGSVGLVVDSPPYIFEERQARVRQAAAKRHRCTGKSARAKRAREWAAQRRDS